MSAFARAFAPSVLLALILGATGVAGSDAPAALAPSTNPSGTMRPASAADRTRFAAMSKAFTSTSLKAEVQKRFRVELTQQEKNSSGRLEINRGRVRLELDKGDENTLLVVNSKEILAVTFPPADLPNSPTQVVRISRKGSNVFRQGLLALLAERGFDKSFTITGVSQSGDELEYFLSPKSKDLGLRRAQARVAAATKTLRELRYWDELGNETHLRFDKTRVGEPIPMARFVFQIPKGAEVLSENH
jgi:outer membrane lipoprotein-sorting protein